MRRGHSGSRFPATGGAAEKCPKRVGGHRGHSAWICLMETGSKFAGGSEKFAAVQVQGAMVQITAKAAPVCNVVSSMKSHSAK